jgi:hypothetical protein
VSVPAPTGAGLPAVTGATGLPAVNQALEPTWVRRGSASTQKAYETALAFEETLVEQLSQSLTATSGLEGEGAQEGEAGQEGGALAPSAGGGEISSLLPQALTGGVMQAGGLGLAAQLTRELQGSQGIDAAAQARLAGGTAPTAPGATSRQSALQRTTPAPGGTTPGGTTAGGTTPQGGTVAGGRVSRGGGTEA